MKVNEMFLIATFTFKLPWNVSDIPGFLESQKWSFTIYMFLLFSEFTLHLLYIYMFLV